MNTTKLNEAIREAERFLERARAFKAEDGPAQSGACRRASMDLTRALAALRARGS